MRRPAREYVLSSVIACVAGLSTAAQAQVAPASGASPEQAAQAELDAVIVTAQRRDEQLQDVPVAVTAITGAQLERARVADLRNLAAMAPGLNTGRTPGSDSQLAVALRGIVGSSPATVQDSPIGLYVNEFYYARLFGSNLSLIDVGQIEVLRGPQGTLFGRNTIGGAVTITTRRPTDEFEGWLEGVLGNHGRRNLTGVVNIPLIDGKLQIRAVGAHLEHSGYSRNAFLGRDLDTQNANYGRLSLAAELSDSVRLDLVGDVMRDRFNPQATRLLYVTPGSVAAGLPALFGRAGDDFRSYMGPGIHTAYGDYFQRNDLDAHSISGTLTADLGFATFKNIAGYRYAKITLAQDLDSTPYPILHVVKAPTISRSVSEEVQLYGTLADGAIDWITGAIYFQEHGTDNTATQALLPLTNRTTFNMGKTRNISVGAFAEVSYEFLPGWKATAGVRYAKDTRRVTYLQHAISTINGAVTCTVPVALRDPAYFCASVPREVKSDYFPFTLGLDYKVNPDVLLYGKYTEGFRSGGFPTAGPVAAESYAPFAPEKLKSIEGGIKAQWFDGRLDTNLAIYSSDYSNVQVTQNQVAPNNSIFTLITNSGSKEIWGVEFEARARLGDLALNFGYGHVEVDSVEGPANFVGRPTIFVPEDTFTLGADYTMDLGGGVLRLHADYNYRSRVYFAPVQSLPGSPGYELTQQPGFGLLNAQISYEIKSVTVSVFGRNIADKDYFDFGSDVSANPGLIFNYPGEPRTYGVILRTAF